MRNYIILNGKNSNTITGLLISTLPPITKPSIRTQTEEIDGLDGDIVTKLGYSAYEKEFEIGLYGEFDINEVIAYFNTEGTVVFSNEDDKYYNYQIISQIDYDKLIRFKKASIKMHVQPFKYPLTETPVEIEIQNVNNEAEAIDLDNTAEAPMTLALKGNTSQSGTPTPTSPIPVSVVSGDNDIVVCGKNLLDTNFTTTTINGITYTLNSNKTITIKGTSSASGNILVGTTTLPAGTYKVSADMKYAWGTSRIEITGTGSTIALFSTNKEDTITLTGTTTLEFRAIVSGTGTQVDYTIGIMLNTGTTALPYEPYQSQTYPIDLPVENLINNASFTAGGGTTIDSYDNNSITGTYHNAYTALTQYINATTNKYTLSVGNISNSSARIEFYKYKNGSAVGSANIVNANSSYTIDNTDNSADQLRITLSNGNLSGTNEITFNNIQLEVGSKVNTFVPYNTTPIELCKIGTYQDYFTKNSEGQWCKYNAIGKVVLTGADSESWSYGTSGGYPRTTFNSITDGYVYTDTNRHIGLFINNYFKPNTDSETGNCYQYQNTYLFVPTSDITSLALWKTWLSSHNTTLYYVLSTPYLSLIEDEALIGQLNALEQARSYDTKTHINQNANDKPYIINATAVQKGSDTGTVDNEGNIYSKPTIDIEGSGTADIYLNNNQIFSVDLSSSNECIIDTAKLEAYNPSTNALMNRQVTGDYSSFILNTGENTIKISGNVTKATISNYTRWL